MRRVNQVRLMYLGSYRRAMMILSAIRRIIDRNTYYPHPMEYMEDFWLGLGSSHQAENEVSRQDTSLLT